MNRISPRTKVAFVALMTLVVPILMSLFPRTATTERAEAATAPISLATMRSVDVMKYTKDTITNQPSDADIQSIVNALATMNITHIALSVPMDPASDYPATSKPYPRDPYAFTQAWADAIHAKGLHIIWRGTWSGIEGIYGFQKLVGPARFPAGIAASAATDGNSTWLGKTYQYIVNHPGFFQDGDVWAPLPERTEGIFQDSTSFLPYSGAGVQANYTQFFTDLKTVSNQAFQKIGKNVTTGMTTNNASEILSGWLSQSIFDTNNITTADYYGTAHTPQEMDAQVRQMASMHGHPVFLQEWADYWNDDASMTQAQRTAYLQSMYSEMQTLANQGILAGFNYWGGWSNSQEGILTQDSSGYHLNYRGQLLAQFFATNTGTPVVTPAQPATSSTPPVAPTTSASSTISIATTSAPTNSPTPSSTSSLTCPGPASRQFTGCYYSDKNLGNLTDVRMDKWINFDWGAGSPFPNMPVDGFSARWQGNFPFGSGTFRFTMTSDDGSRLYVDGNPVIDAWTDHPATTYTADVTLPSGIHTLKMEYYEEAGGAMASLSWQKIK